MSDLSNFDPNSVGNPNFNIFGLPSTEEEARLVILPIPWEVTVSYNAGTARAPDHICKGSLFLNDWVYEQTRELLAKGKLVGLLGGDHSTPLGYFKAIADKHGDFGILQIDAHCDLRKAYEGFNYSHASIMYNAIEQIPQ